MAILLHDRLTAKGYKVFLDVESLNSGSFNTQLLDVIEACKDVVVVLSEGALDRCANPDDWVRAELAYAFKHNKNIIPFMLRGFSWNKDLPEDISLLPLQNGINASSNEYFDASVQRLTQKFLKSKPDTILKIRKKYHIIAAVLVFLSLIVLSELLIGNSDNDDKNYGGKHDSESNITTTVTTSAAAANNPHSRFTPQEIQERITDRTLSASFWGIAAIQSDGKVLSYDIKEDLLGWSDIISVSIGFDHILGLKKDGTVLAMGSNDFSQCNVRGSYWKNIIAIEAGTYASFGIRSDGTVTAVGSFINMDTFEEIDSWRDIIMLATGSSHIVGLKADGSVVAAGGDLYGETLVSGWSDIVAVAAYSYFTIGLKSDGTVVTTGDNEWEHDWENYFDEPAPDWCSDPRNWTDIKAISVGNVDIIGVKHDGTVVVSHGRERGTEGVAGWSDIATVVQCWRNIIGLKSDGTVVYTLNSAFDDIGDELDDWGDLRVSS